MAKVIGPLNSFQASGTFAGTVTFKRSRAQNVAGIRPVPTQRYTEAQAEAKSLVQITGEVSRRVFRDQAGQSDVEGALTPLVFLQGIAVPPLTWLNMWVRFEFPSGRTTLSEELTAYEGLTTEQQTAWETWNNALSVPFVDIAPREGGTRTIEAEEVAFMFARGMARAGYLTTIPLGTPPTWEVVPEMRSVAKEFKKAMFPPLQSSRGRRGKKEGK